MSRLSIDVTEQQHQSLKAMAALQGKTIKEYAIEKLFPLESDVDQALVDLKAVLQQRMTEADNDDVDTRSFMEIAQAALKSGT
jgi:pyruvate-formate lyase-activating enzyme